MTDADRKLITRRLIVAVVYMPSLAIAFLIVMGVTNHLAAYFALDTSPGSIYTRVYPDGNDSLRGSP